MQTPEQSEYYSELPIPVEPPQPVQLPGPNNPPWNSVEGVGLWIASVALILFVPALFLFPYLATLTSPPIDNNELVEFAKTDPTAIVVQILAIIPAHLLTLLVAWLIVTRIKKHSFTTMLGWRSGGVRWWHYPVILIVFFAIAYTVGYYFPEQDNDMLKMLRTSRVVVYLVAFVATFTAPVVEEVVYRGVLYSSLQRSIGVAGAFLITTFLFAVVHVPQYWPSFATISLLVLLSIVLTSIRVVSNNLWPCIVLHTIFNGLQSVALLLGSATEAPPTAVPEQVSTILNLFS